MNAFLQRAVFTAAILILAGAGPGPARGGDTSGAWRPAAGSREWSFPADHGSHPEYQTEWWYFTGNLASDRNREWGYQLTFFRVGAVRTAPDQANPWSVRDLYLAHFAITDGHGQRFFWTERTSRAGPGLAGAMEGRCEVWVLDWRASLEEGSFHLTARDGEMALDLALAPRKKPVLHGDGGLSVKGPEHGQASWYASITDLQTQGTLTVPGEEAVAVTGSSWFDHEFGSNQLADDQEGWDWFSLQLSDGTEVMLYQLRRTDGTVEPASSGTLVQADGSVRHLSLEEFSIKILKRWESEKSGGDYPSRWRITVPTSDLDVDVKPLVKDQELTTEGTAGITYWEGAVKVKGRSGGQEITGVGYVELTGYAGGLGGIF